MLKFRCQQCGHRIAVGARHLGKLVTCPECGGPTHPLAEQIVSIGGSTTASVHRSEEPIRRRTVSVAGVTSTSRRERNITDDQCANCGEIVGRLQSRDYWDGHVVCRSCHDRLSSERPAPIRDASPSVLVLENSNRGAVATRIADTLAPLPVIATAPLLVEARRGISPNRPSPLHTASLSLNTRLLIILAVICLAGAAVYGALSLLRDLTGVLTAAAFIVFAIACLYLLVKSVTATTRRIRGRLRGHAG